MSLYRPGNLSEMIGNENIRKSLIVTINSSKVQNLAFPHALIYAPPGTGKTTLANIIANEMGGDFKSFLSNVFRTKDDVRLVLKDLNQEGYGQFNGEITGKIKPSIIFLDEIHQLSTKVQEAFFEAMEDFKFTGDSYDIINSKRIKTRYWIPRFSLLAATTKAGDLDEAFVSRFKLVFTLNLYSESELAEIVRRWCIHFGVKITDEALKEVTKRARGVPRKALNLTERCKDNEICMGKKEIDIEVATETFKQLDIDSGGLEPQDRMVLIYLFKIYPQKIGVTRLANTLNLSEGTLKEIIDPYLLRMNLIIATPGGRIISEKGQEYVESNKLVETNKVSGLIRRIS